MKKIIPFFLMLVLIMVVACPGKQQTEKPSVDTGAETASEEPPEPASEIPSVIKNPRGAGIYEQTADNRVEFIGTRLELFDTVIYLGTDREMTYLEGSKEEKGMFSLCLVKIGSDTSEKWIYTDNLGKDTRLAAVTKGGFLYNRDQIAKISDKEVKVAQVVIMDSSYSHFDFNKIWVPEISATRVFYMLKKDLSTDSDDISVSRLYTTAMAFPPEKEKAKIQILDTALNTFPKSDMLYLVEEELMEMGAYNPMGTGMEDADMDLGRGGEGEDMVGGQLVDDINAQPDDEMGR